jgi:hypothetical protein
MFVQRDSATREPETPSSRNPITGGLDSVETRTTTTDVERIPIALDSGEHVEEPIGRDKV